MTVCGWVWWLSFAWLALKHPGAFCEVLKGRAAGKTTADYLRELDLLADAEAERRSGLG